VSKKKCYEDNLRRNCLRITFVDVTWVRHPYDLRKATTFINIMLHTTML